VKVPASQQTFEMLMLPSRSNLGMRDGEGGKKGRGMGVADPAVSREFANIFKDHLIDTPFDECKSILVKN
jgi:hypothetical protein